MPKKADASFKSRFIHAKEKLLKDSTICQENRDLFEKFYEYQEYKLPKINDIRILDEGTYKTLYAYIIRFRNINRWFKNKPLVDLSKEDIKAVYDGLEEGTIVRPNGMPYLSRADYYNKVFKSKLFKLAGKVEISEEVMEYYRKSHDKEVRFFAEEDFRKIEHCMYKPLHKLLAWIEFDVGENINSTLKLVKQDLFRQMNPTSGKPEYRVNLRKEILKRSRTPRSVVTNYDETAELLDQILPDLKDNELVFPFGYNNSVVILARAVKRSKVKCQPKGEIPSWKDFRSSMACDILRKGYSTDDVNKRLGHKASSSEIDKYVNFLALDTHEPKKKLFTYNMDKIQHELEETRQRAKINDMRMENMVQQLEEMKSWQEKVEKAWELEAKAKILKSLKQV